MPDPIDTSAPAQQETETTIQAAENLLDATGNNTEAQSQQSENTATATTPVAENLLGDSQQTSEQSQVPADFNEYRESLELGDGFAIGKDSAGNDVTSDYSAYEGAIKQFHEFGWDKETAKAGLQIIQDVERARYESAMAQGAAEAKRLADMSRQEFGTDMPTVISDAKRGGLDTFGPALWSEISRVPQLANNPDFLRGMARIGRMLRHDNGTSANPNAAASGSGNSLSSFDITRWLRSSGAQNL